MSRVSFGLFFPLLLAQACDGDKVSDTGCDGGESVDLSEASAKIEGESDGDGAGTSIWAGDLDGDGVTDALVGARSDDSGGVWAGAAYVVRGPMSGTIDRSCAPVKFVGEEAGDRAGTAVWGADVNGDGRGDALIAAPEQDLGHTDAGTNINFGAVYLVVDAGL